MITASTHPKTLPQVHGGRLCSRSCSRTRRDRRDMRQQERRLGCGHRDAVHRDHRAPTQQPFQVLLMSGTPLSSTHTTSKHAGRRGTRGGTKHYNNTEQRLMLHSPFECTLRTLPYRDNTIPSRSFRWLRSTRSIHLSARTKEMSFGSSLQLLVHTNLLPRTRTRAATPRSPLVTDQLPIIVSASRRVTPWRT